jgi:hypothetical protein
MQSGWRPARVQVVAHNLNCREGDIWCIYAAQQLDDRLIFLGARSCIFLSVYFWYLNDFLHCITEKISLDCCRYIVRRCVDSTRNHWVFCFLWFLKPINKYWLWYYKNLYINHWMLYLWYWKKIMPSCPTLAWNPGSATDNKLYYDKFCPAPVMEGRGRRRAFGSC